MSRQVRRRPLRPAALVACLAMLLALVTGAGTARAAGTVQGTVTGDGSPLPDVGIELVDGVVVASTTTDTSGAYTLDVEAGTYDLVATPPAGSPYGPVTLQDVVVSDAAAQQVDVVLVLVDGALPPVTGDVAVVDVGPVGGAEVTLRRLAGTTVVVTSAADGSFSAQPVDRDGSLTVEATGACDATTPAAWSVQTSYDVDTRTDYPVTPTFRPLTVTVVDPDGAPVSGASVQVVSDRISQASAAPLGASVTALSGFGSCTPTTDADGEVVLAAVPGGTARITANADGFSPGLTEATVGSSGGADVVQLLPGPVEVSGTVVGWDGAPVVGLDVLLGGQLDETDAGGTFTVQVPPGTATLELGGALGFLPGLGRNFFAEAEIVVPDVGGDLGTWQAPVAAVDTTVTLADTGDELTTRLSTAVPVEVDTGVFGFPGTARSTVFYTSAGTTTIPLPLLAGATYPVTLLDVPPGYVDPSPWQLTAGAVGERTSASLALDPVALDAPLTGCVLQAGVAVTNALVVDRVNDGQVRTGPDGCFTLDVAPGEGELGLSLASSSASRPDFSSARLRGLTVPAEGLDLGDLELPYVPLDVSIGVPDGDVPVTVGLETSNVGTFVDAGWGPMSFNGGYLESTGDDLSVVADGTATRLWLVPGSGHRFTITPDPDGPYEPILEIRTVTSPGSVLYQLQRTAAPNQPPVLDVPDDMEVPESVDEVALPVTANDPEGGDVSVTWQVSGSEAEDGTGLPVPLVLGPQDGPRTITAVATACDDLEACTSDTVVVSVTDVPPTLDVAITGDATAGREVVVQVDVDDPRDPVTVEVDWGDGSSDVLADAGGASLAAASTAASTAAARVAGSLTHVYAGPGEYDLVVRAVTADATASDTRVLTVAAAEPEPDPTPEPTPDPTPDPTPEPTPESDDETQVRDEEFEREPELVVAPDVDDPASGSLGNTGAPAGPGLLLGATLLVAGATLLRRGHRPGTPLRAGSDPGHGR